MEEEEEELFDALFAAKQLLSKYYSKTDAPAYNIAIGIYLIF
jgi:hypothetical protein